MGSPRPPRSPCRARAPSSPPCPRCPGSSSAARAGSAPWSRRSRCSRRTACPGRRSRPRRRCRPPCSRRSRRGCRRGAARVLDGVLRGDVGVEETADDGVAGAIRRSGPRHTAHGPSADPGCPRGALLGEGRTQRSGRRERGLRPTAQHDHPFTGRMMAGARQGICPRRIPDDPGAAARPASGGRAVTGRGRLRGYRWCCRPAVDCFGWSR